MNCKNSAQNALKVAIFRYKIEKFSPDASTIGKGDTPSPMGKGMGRGMAPSLENFSILSLKMAIFSAFWALFLQFTVHSSMDCLKRFRRQKPLLVGKLADSFRRQNKRVGNYVVIYAKKN